MENLLDCWEKIKERIRGRCVFLFLDFDGTLSSIVSTPDKAVIPGRVKALLRELSCKDDFKVAIISGRALADIRKRIGVKGIIYSGNHGHEVESPRIDYKMQMPRGYLQALSNLRQELKSKLKGVNGAYFEDKGISLAVHFREASKQETSIIKTIFRETTIIPSVAKKVKIRTGKKVIEVGPPGEWNKGKMVLWLLSRQKFCVGDREIVPFYLGDDLTDEDAFMALKKEGITVLVGDRRPSCASYYLKGPEEVYELLSLIHNI